MDIMQNAARIAKKIRERSGPEALSAGIVLGSGWNGVAEALEDKTVIPYSALEGMPRCGVEGHAGNFVIGRSGKAKVVAVQGRFHLYEGRAISEAVLPVAVLYELGVRTLLLTNAAGGVNYSYAEGDMMILRDHINFTGRNPLEGVRPSPDRPVFIDMTQAYDEKLSSALEAAFVSAHIPVKRGVYMQLLGPSFETPAEIRAFRGMGADAVGMSTVMETIFARYLGMRVCAVSCITNLAAGMTGRPLAHGEVLAAFDGKQKKIAEAVLEFIGKL